MPETIGRLLERAASNRETGLRLLDRAEHPTFYPWPEVWRRSLEVCGRLQSFGIAPGDRVALVFPTSIEFIEAFFGSVLAGAVPVPLYPPVRLHRLEDYGVRTARMLRAVSARLVLADSRVRPILGNAVADVGPELGCRTLKDLPTGSGEMVDRDAGELALIQFSSGTTVDPKPVALSHRAVVSHAVTLNSHWPDGNGCTHSGVSWLPLYHDMGLIGCVLTALERPGSMTLIPPELFLARPAIWLRSISTYGATISVAPNFGFSLATDRIEDAELDGVDLSEWRVALCGAEPVVPEVLRRFIDRFERWGLRSETLSPVYGLSEATLAVTFSDLHRRFVSRFFDREALSTHDRAVESASGVEMVSVGRPLDGAEVRVVDAERRVLAEGRVGDVLVRGPSIMDGYFDRPGATREVLVDDWLDTGDRGFLHRGDLFLTGRKKDVLILRGRSHSPTEVEAAVDTVYGVRVGCSVAVSWLPEGADGEVLLLLIEIGRGMDGAQAGELAESCRSAVRSATGLEADRVEVLEPGTLPRTSSGKLRRQESLRMYLTDELDPPKAATPWRLAGAAVRGSLKIARMHWNNRD